MNPYTNALDAILKRYRGHRQEFDFPGDEEEGETVSGKKEETEAETEI